MPTSLTEKIRRLDERARAVEEIAARRRARTILNGLSEDEILGYDENGIPR